jgi:succinoglycan biosynthesis transport protein ExoP
VNDFVQLRQYANILRRSWWVIVLVAALGGGIGYELSGIQPKIYTAYTTLIVGQSIDAANLESKDFQVGEQLVQTYANLVRREPVLRGTVEALKLSSTWQELRLRVQTRRVEGTQLLEIVVEADSPEEARRTANEIARQLMLLGPATHQQDAETSFVSDQLTGLRSKIEASQARIDKLQAVLAALEAAEPLTTQLSKQAQEIQREIDTSESLIADWQNNYTQIIGIRSRTKSSNNLTVIEPGQVDISATRPKKLVNTLVAGGVSMSLAVVYLLLRASLNSAIGSVEDIGSLLGLVSLGSIGIIKGKHLPQKLITVRKPFSEVSESYRILSGNLWPILADRQAQTILVTSPVAGEGKTITVANLAVVMAQSGLKTIVVDADLRRPRLHEIFELSNAKGLTDLVQSSEVKISPVFRRSKQRGRSTHVVQSSEVEIHDILQSTGMKNLQVITSGTLPPNPSELLNLFNSLHMRQLLAGLKEMADVILVDSSPILPVADTAALSNKMDAVILVIQAEHTKQDVARQAVSNLQQVDAKLLGGVLNRVPSRRGARYANVATHMYHALGRQVSLREGFVTRDRSVWDRFSTLFIRQPTNGYDDAQGSQDVMLDSSEERHDAIVLHWNIPSVVSSSTQAETIPADDNDTMTGSLNDQQ